MIRIKKRKFRKLNGFFERIKEAVNVGVLDKYGEEGVIALSANTPVDTGETASSWGYEIEHAKGKAIIHFTNSNVNNYVNIAIILQYGHGTGTGGWVEGIDYINPAIQPVFNKIADAAWEEVMNA